MSDAPISSGAPAAPAATPSSTPAPTQSSAPASGDIQAVAAIAADPTATPAEKAQAKKMLKQLKIKVDGQDYTEDLPFEMEDNQTNRDWMTKQLQMSKVSQKRMGEKAALEKEVNQFIGMLKGSPTEQRKALAMFGADVKKLAASVIEEEIENSKKSPEQKEKEALLAELQQMKEARDQEKKSAEEREFNQLTQQTLEKFENDIITSLSSSDLPRTPYVTQKIAQYVRLGMTQGFDVSVADVLPIVREEIINDIKAMSQAMPVETLEQLFGSDILGKIRKKNIAKAKEKKVAQAKVPDAGVIKDEAPSEPARKRSFKEEFGF